MDKHNKEKKEIIEIVDGEINIYMVIYEDNSYDIMDREELEEALRYKKRLFKKEYDGTKRNRK